MKIDLTDYGLTERYIAEKTLYDPNLFIARVTAQYRNLYKAITEDGEVSAEISGKMQYQANSLNDYPAIGDFVLVDRTDNINGNAIIYNVLKRKTYFERRVPGEKIDVQIIAANIDTVFICMSMNENFNLRRLERYLSIAFNSMANPVVLLTKSDLCKNKEEMLEQVYKIAMGVDIIITNVIEESGYMGVNKYITKGKTVAFIGSSGVGKSTLINKILNKDVAKINEIREDGRGRHTTTVRQMFLVETGGILIDTPGMRELGVINADVENTFVDIEELARKCKYRDCKHETEPECAVKKAIEEGILNEQRLINYRKLKKELEYNTLDFKNLEKKKIESMFGSMNEMKRMKHYVKNKDKRR